jgi:hypothetical protein
LHFHKHKIANPTWNIAGRVEKKPCGTPKQAAENSQKPKSKPENQQSCGSRKTVFTT